MIQKNIALLKKDFQETQSLDMDAFDLEVEGEEIISRFCGFQLRSEFQPIRDAGKSGTPVGHEALLRAALGTAPVSPAFAFSVADNQGKQIKLDRIARTLHMLNYLNLPGDKGFLFVNIYPSLLANANDHGKMFEHILHTHLLPPREVVIEIIENAVEADQALVEAISTYRISGYRIAVDNFGSKHSNFDRLWKLQPDFVKLDASIIKRAQTNPRARGVLSKLIEIPQELGARSIVVGIENETQYQIALDAGATLLQGYFLGRPAAAGVWKKRPPVARDNPAEPNTSYHFGNFSGARVLAH